MGACSFVDVGYGMTQEQAMEDAIRRANEESGHKNGYSGRINSLIICEPLTATLLEKPIPPKTCDISTCNKDDEQIWITKYIARTTTGIFICSKDLFLETVKEAEQYAIEHNVKVIVSITKEPAQGKKRITIITPVNSKMGKWEFRGMAHD